MIVNLDKEAVKKLFETETRQVDVLIGIYRMIFPEWDRIRLIHQWPCCNFRTWSEICRMFVEFDYQHRQQVKVMPGGLWMNKGFSQQEANANLLEDWQVDISSCNIQMVAEEQ